MDTRPSSDGKPGVVWTTDVFLDAVKLKLGEPYRRCVDDCFAWLTPFDVAGHERHARIARHGVHRLAELIPGLRVAPPAGGWPAILFASVDAQLAYDGLFGGKGERIISGGSYRSYPVGHLAIPVSDSDSLDAAFAHELVHAILSPRGMPTWFQEGIACEVETRLGNRSYPYRDRHALNEMLDHWRSHPAETFWSGRAFGHPESSRHAYMLAQIIVGRWARDPEALEAVCSIEPGRWDDQDEALGVTREAMMANVLEPPKHRGWLERVLYAVFVGDGK